MLTHQVVESALGYGKGFVTYDKTHVGPKCMLSTKFKRSCQDVNMVVIKY